MPSASLLEIEAFIVFQPVNYFIGNSVNIQFRGIDSKIGGSVVKRFSEFHQFFDTLSRLFNIEQRATPCIHGCSFQDCLRGGDQIDDDTGLSQAVNIDGI